MGKGFFYKKGCLMCYLEVIELYNYFISSFSLRNRFCDYCGSPSLQKEEKRARVFSTPNLFFQMFTPTNNNCSNYFFPPSSSYTFPLLYHPSAFENNNASSSSLSSAAANATVYHHDHLSSLPFIPTLIPEALTNNLAAPSEYASVVGRQQNIALDCNIVSGNFISNKKPSSKKDRHSKIYTSQGLRDRRVRLSIEIARKFFDLQDMLGFDKASNTLDWLFTKSKKAIQELEKAPRSKKKSSSTSKSINKSFSSSSESEEVVSPQRVDSDSGKATRPETAEKAKKELREKARARARERANHNKGNSLMVVYGAETSETIRREEHNKENEECTVIKRKTKQPCNLMNSSNHLQNHFLIPNHKEASFTNNTTFINTTTATTTHDYSIFPNLTPNWDTNGPSNFCAITDMNLSTDLQIYGKSREE